MEEIERRFTPAQIGLQFYLAKKEQLAAERRQAELHSKMTAAELAPLMAQVLAAMSGAAI